MTSFLLEWLSAINQQTASASEDVEKSEPFFTVGGNADWCNHCGKQCGDNLQNKMGLPFDPADPAISLREYIHPKKPKTLI